MKRCFLILCLALSGCASVDYDYPRSESRNLPVADDTQLDRRISALTAGKPAGVSGFDTLPDGIDAIAARLRLAEEAERSIDVQYYLIKRDRVGQEFLRVLLAAADRGVRVRMLLDDMFNKGFDRDMAALSSHENFEIRVINPFRRNFMGRSLGAALEFPRINRRMHNKSFTVDRRVTVIGGRNIADEYFGAREDSAFGDLDVVAIGPVVDDVADMFERYWTYRTAVPVAGFAPSLDDPAAALAELRERLALNHARLEETRYAQAIIDRAYADVEQKIDAMRWSPYRLIYDTPDKTIRKKADRSDMIVTPLAESLSTATEELLILSPYFVPTRALQEHLVDASKRGVQVTVVTNSLAANNQKKVHGGYAPSRKPLLKAGVKLYEVRPDAMVAGTEFVEAGSARSTLHAKTYVIDRREIFIGSFNFDPRSAFINTEMGVLIQNPQLGADYAARLTNALPPAVWEVSLTENDSLLWSGAEQGELVTYTREPMTGWWERAKAVFYRLLPIRNQL